MAMRATFWKTEQTGKQTKVGELRIEKGGIRSTLPKSMWESLQDDIVGRVGSGEVRKLTVGEDPPEAILRALAQQFSGSYLRVTLDNV